MRKKVKLIVLVALCVVTLFSCSKKDSLSMAIPKDVAMVMKVDLKNLARKANYKLMDNSLIKGSVELMKSTVNDDKKKMIDDFLKNPNSLGVNIIDDMYFFITADGTMGGVLSVSDSKKFYDNLLKIDPNFKEMIKIDKGIYSLKTNEAYGIAWDKARLVVRIYSRFADETQTNGRTPIESLLQLKKGDSFYGTDNYKKLAEVKNDISFFYSPKEYAKWYQSLSASNFVYTRDMDDAKREQMDKSILSLMEGIAYNMIGGCNFENGKIMCSSKIFFDTPEAEAKYNSLKTLNAKIDGELNKYVPSNSILYFAAHLSGKDILADINTLKADGILDYINEDSKFNVRDILLALNGDIIVSLNKVNLSNQQKSAYASLFAKVDTVKIKSVMDSILTKNKESGVVLVKANNYVTSSGLMFGVQNGIFYITSDSTDYVNFGKGGIPNRQLDKIKGQTFYFGGDMRVLKEELMPVVKSEGLGLGTYSGLIDEFLGLATTFETHQKDKYNTTFEVVFADSKTNSLEQIFKFIDKAVNSLGQLFLGSM